MADGTVTATSLNLRDAPNGVIIGSLPQDTVVTVLREDDGWLNVAKRGEQTPIGWVRAGFVRIGPAAGPIPPADDAAHPVTVDGTRAIGPDGAQFATVRNPGFMTIGQTALPDWLRAHPMPAGISPSIVRVLRAVSLNEGKLEAINSYDDAFLSFGMFQWTAGTGNAAGELAAFLALVQRTDAGTFAEYFGRYSLGVAGTSATATTGFLTIDGSALRSEDDKQQLRDPEWAYRFWRAGHDDIVRRCELLHAAARIEQFHRKTAAGHPLSAWLTSECGIALVLDEHVNRPGHVPGTLEDAIGDLSDPAPNPTNWATDDEKALIRAYIEARNGTNMTKPAERAEAIEACVTSGTLSDQRGSFVSTAAATGA
jgi:SH3 domain-containing protein